MGKQDGAGLPVGARHRFPALPYNLRSGGTAWQLWVVARVSARIKQGGKL